MATYKINNYMYTYAFYNLKQAQQFFNFYFIDLDMKIMKMKPIIPSTLTRE